MLWCTTCIIGYYVYNSVLRGILVYLGYQKILWGTKGTTWYLGYYRILRVLRNIHVTAWIMRYYMLLRKMKCYICYTCEKSYLFLFIFPIFWKDGPPQPHRKILFIQTCSFSCKILILKIGILLEIGFPSCGSVSAEWSCALIDRKQCIFSRNLYWKQEKS